MHFICANIFGAIVLNLRLKIDAVVIVIWSIVIIINSVLTLHVLTASLPHDRDPCETKVVSNHTCSLHTCVCAGSRRVRVRLSGFRRQGISLTPGGFLKCPIPVWVCAEQLSSFWIWLQNIEPLTIGVVLRYFPPFPPLSASQFCVWISRPRPAFALFPRVNSANYHRGGGGRWLG